MDGASLTGTNVPENWWQYRHVCEALSQSHRKHLLALHVHGAVDGKFRQAVYTGFLLDIGTHILWMTAGHVIDGLQKIVHSSDTSSIKAEWMDHHENPHASGMPLDLAATQMFSANKSSGSDWGCIALRSMYQANIAANPRVEVLRPEVWEGIKNSNPAGYHLVGMAAERVEHAIVGTMNGKAQWRSQIETQCLPVQHPVESIPNTEPEFWDHPGDFFGQLTNIVGCETPIAIDIAGMSGGPVFSIEREGDSGVRYRLVGVQSGWLPTSRIIRATSIHRIADTLKAYWSELSAAGGLPS